MCKLPVFKLPNTSCLNCATVIVFSIEAETVPSRDLHINNTTEAQVARQHQQHYQRRSTGNNSNKSNESTARRHENGEETATAQTITGSSDDRVANQQLTESMTTINRKELAIKADKPPCNVPTLSSSTLSRCLASIANSKITRRHGGLGI